MSVKRITDETMTAEAFLAWSEGHSTATRCELLDGHVVTMSAERAIHARTKHAVAGALEHAIGKRQLPCEMFVDGMAVQVDDDTVFEPDALVRCGKPLPDDAIVITDSLIVVEVASPSTQRVDALLKLTRCFRNPAIVHYLIVMPDGRSVCHHKRGADQRIETTIHTTGRLTLDPPGLSLEIAEFFPSRED